MSSTLGHSEGLESSGAYLLQFAIMRLIGLLILAVPLVPLILLCSAPVMLCLAALYVSLLVLLAVRHEGWRSKIFLLLGIKSRALGTLSPAAAHSSALISSVRELSSSVCACGGGQALQGSHCLIRRRSTPLRRLHTAGTFLRDPLESHTLLGVPKYAFLS
jgi:hypothetical protein